jgi:hypothetical protein
MHDRLEIGDSGAYQIEKIRGGGRERGEGALGKATRSPRRPLPTPLRRGGGGTPSPRGGVLPPPAHGALPASPGFRFARLLTGPGGLVVPPMRPWRIGDGQLNLKRNGPWETSVRRELDWFAAYSG